MDFSSSLVFSRAGARERRIAYGVAIAVIASVVLITPSAHSPGPVSGGFVTAVYTVYVAATILTAWLLFDKYRASRSAPLGVLSVGHAYGAAVVALYLLAFPGAFGAAGIIGNMQTAAWLWVTAHAGFLCFYLAYSVSERLYGRPGEGAGGTAFVLTVGAVTAVVVCALAIAATLAPGRLPPVMLDAVTFRPALRHVIAPALLAGYAFAFTIFVAVTGLRSVRDLWLGVVLVALAGEVTAGCIVSGARFTYGWYLGCAEGAVAALAFLIVLLRESNRLLVEFARNHRVLVERTMRDELTDLLNRRGFDERMDTLLRQQRREPARAALLMVDVDHFKDYNDRYGHLAGDETLRAIGATIAAAIHRPQDSCCRIGGDEFAIILPGTDEAGALTVAERIHHALASLGIPRATELEAEALSVSVGVASSGEVDERDASTLHARADVALYEAKRLGRNRTATYSSIGVARSTPLPV